MEESERVTSVAKPFMGAWMLPCHSLLTVLLIAVTASALANTLPGCPARCGDVSIPYPFGIGPNCSFPAPGFALTCNNTGNGAYKPYLTNVEFINIDLPAAQARIYNYISSQCYNDTSHIDAWALDFSGEPYRFSDAKNKFIVFGCESRAYIGGQNQNNSYESGCVSVCQKRESRTNGSCSGVGCCETCIPKEMNYYQVIFDGYFNYSGKSNSNTCSYAVLAEVNWIDFSKAHINRRNLNETNGGRAPMVLDWAIGSETCEFAKSNRTSYACRSEHTHCFDSSNGPGYFCSCSEGYEGNPYLPDGCQDIDEYTLKEEYPCYGICSNTDGGYICSCPPGTNGDPTKRTCNHDNTFSAMKLVIGIVTSTSFAIVLLLCFIISMVHERRKLMRIKEEYFQRYGGRLLLEERKSKQGLEFKVFKKE